MLYYNEKIQCRNGKFGTIEIDPKSRSENSLRPFQKDLFDMLLSKSWIKLIHRSFVERKLSAENDKEVLVSVVI